MVTSGETILGRYRLQLPLGERETGAVWRAEDTNAKRPAAIAIVPPLEAAPGRVERFLEQMKKVQKAPHPHIVTVREVGTLEGGEGYAVMELLEGKMLAERLGDEPAYTVEELMNVSRQILDGLAAFHAVGGVHGDLEPGNVYLIGTGKALVPKLIGFGASRAAARAGLPGEIDPDDEGLLRSMAYMSPEQASKSAAIDSRSDVYSFGVVLYDALVGRLPYLGDSEDELRDAIMRGGAVPVEQVRTDVPAALSRVVERAMSLEPGQRFENASAMRKALVSALVLAPKAAKLTLPVVARGQHRASQVPPVPSGPAKADIPTRVVTPIAVGSPNRGLPAADSGREKARTLMGVAPPPQVAAALDALKRQTEKREKEAAGDAAPAAAAVPAADSAPKKPFEKADSTVELRLSEVEVAGGPPPPPPAPPAAATGDGKFARKEQTEELSLSDIRIDMASQPPPAKDDGAKEPKKEAAPPPPPPPPPPAKAAEAKHDAKHDAKAPDPHKSTIPAAVAPPPEVAAAASTAPALAALGDEEEEESAEPAIPGPPAPTLSADEPPPVTSEWAVPKRKVPWVPIGVAAGVAVVLLIVLAAAGGDDAAETPSSAGQPPETASTEGTTPAGGEGETTPPEAEATPPAGEGEQAAAPEGETAPAGEGAEGAEGATPPVAEGEGAAPVAEATPPPPPEPATITLRNVRRGATVTLDGEAVEGTRVRVPRDSERHLIEVSAEGWSPWRHELVAESDQTLTVEQERLEVAAVEPQPRVQPRTQRTPQATAQQARPRPPRVTRPRGGGARATKPGGRGLVRDPGF